jgi:hemerythrin superfamily protein
MPDEATDLVSVLTRDHDEVKELFQKIDTAPDAQTQRGYADQVTAELVRHAVAEEMYLYPAARDVLPDGDRLADEELKEHAEAEELLKRWEKLDPGDAEFVTVFREMSQSVLHHIAEEEGELFPQLQQHLSSTQMEELGEKISKAKQLAPTRPHPSAPDEPPMDKLLGPPMGVVDRLRDKMSGRETG